MKLKFSIALLLATFLLGACQQQVLYPVDGASTDNVKTVVRLREGSMLLRGLDGQRLDATKIPNPFTDFLYIFQPGTHTLWGKNIQGGHALFPENLRCYAIGEVELKAGVVYRLDEDKDMPRAILKREDTGEQVATGRLIDRKAAYTEDCNWK